MKDKEALIRKTLFPPPPKSIIRELRIRTGLVYLGITKEQVYDALMAQSTKKAPGPDKIDFGIFRRIWNWEAERMTQMVQQTIWLGYHLKEWKRARGILLEKMGK